jgi:DNA-binding NarL/FixJ family response regulator
MASREAPNRPLVVLMDLDMPRMGGIEAIQHGARRYPDTSFLVLTVFDEDEKIFEAIRAGALGYLLKDETLGGITQAIISAVEFGGAPMSPRIARKALQLLSNKMQIAEPEKPAELSERETEILKNLVDGLDYKAIAELMFISPHTVRKHIANIYDKLHVNNRAQAVGLALRKKWF